MRMGAVRVTAPSAWGRGPLSHVRRSSPPAVASRVNDTAGSERPRKHRPTNRRDNEDRSDQERLEHCSFRVKAAPSQATSPDYCFERKAMRLTAIPPDADAPFPRVFAHGRGLLPVVIVMTKSKATNPEGSA